MALFPLLMLVAACGEDAGDLLAKAQSDFAAHDYRSARLNLIAALKQDPGNRDMQLLQARTLLALGDGDGAGALLERLKAADASRPELVELSAEAALLRVAPDKALNLLGDLKTPEAERLRALAALQSDDINSAETHFANAVASGDNARAFADYARLRLLQGNRTAANDLITRAEHIAPQGLDTLLIRARYAQQAGDLQKALGRYSQAARLYPSNLAALLGEAEVRADLGQLDQLDSLLAQVGERGGQGLEVDYLKARLALARKKWADVRKIVQPLEARIPKLHPIRMTYAEALLELGQYQLAAAQIQPIVQSAPNNRLAVKLLAQAQLAAGDAQAALATYRPIAESSEARPEELVLMARIAKAAKDPNASRYAARAATSAPETLGRDLAEADAAMRAKDWARAVTAYDRILAVTDGRNAIVLNNMAYAQLMLGNDAKALDYAERALKLAPDNSSVLDTAGWTLFKIGKDPARAKEFLRRAAEMAPNNATIQEHYALASGRPR
ncbi:hypothetical protein MB02_01000 [Croceicoccus estronivorus]|uniref:tetratricopeptide repeat protein n=1 Tax=Croceicoccus estronivorus TaxID=1172626 RepID=UPI00083385B4|nr:tetratricopeptide repeat protein [Croceicoccus estronivorus]OCC25283.1 hypothetical protein MB02_01000 [Croceicoccus estronivorus]